MRINIKQALKSAVIKLKKQSATSALLDSKILLAYVLKQKKEFLFTYPEKFLTKNQLSRFNKLIAKRATGIPVAYLTHHKEFYGLNFYVNKYVLIPRPETELLITEALKLLSTFNLQPSTTLADIGTGSGAIPVAIAATARTRRGALRVLASDISKSALAVAKRNARTHGVKIKFLHGDLLQPIKNKKIDIIIANLPYIPKNQKKRVTLRAPLVYPAGSSVEGRHVISNTIGLKFEPTKALYSGTDGLDAYRKFFTQAAKLKFKPKYILIEYSGPQQTAELKKIIKSHLPTAKIQIKKDLCGLDRAMIIKNQN